MDNIEVVGNAFNEIIADFKNTLSIDEFNAQLIITPNIEESYELIRGDLVKEGKVDPRELNDYNGLTVQPNSHDGEFTILINEAYLLNSLKNNDFYWVGTIAHEASHVVDFKEYDKLVQPETYDDLFDFEKHRMFLHWTEFRAKAVGYYFIRKYLFSNLYDRNQVHDIFERELPYQIEYLVKTVSETSNVDKQLYTAMHFLGRLAVWQYLFPIDFDDSVISSLFNDNPWMEEMYYFLIEHGTLDKVYNSLDEMERILDKHFC